MTGGVTGAVSGHAADGFGAVADAFARAVPAAGPGGAFAAVVDGRVVVDLWAGTARDDGARWRSDTPVVVFSGTKGMVAVAVMRLVEEGVLALDRPVAADWPAFAAAGKASLTLADVLAHRAGLPALREPMPASALLDPVRIEESLAGQPPDLPAGSVSYHALTYGWLVDGIVRHAAGVPVAQVFAQRVAAPLALDAWVGVPDDVLPRVAQVRRAPGYSVSALAGPDEPDPLLALVYGNPPLLQQDWSSPQVLQAQVPAANGVVTARSMARMYGDLVRGDGDGLLRPATVAAATRPAAEGTDPLSGRLLRFGAGFELAGTPSQLGPAPDAFGHTGSGGSSHGAWPALRTGFSFVTAELRLERDDARARTLLAALHAAVGG